MSPPSSGNYFIKNKASGYYLNSKGSEGDKSGTSIQTTKPSGDLGPAFSFNLSKSDSDLYVFSANESGSNIGAPATVKDGSPIIWTTGDQQFKIQESGPGVYGIRLATGNRYWYDDVAKVQPWRTVLLKTGRTDDSSSWIFQAA